jgi:hypothetical protein
MAAFTINYNLAKEIGSYLIDRIESTMVQLESKDARILGSNIADCAIPSLIAKNAIQSGRWRRMKTWAIKILFGLVFWAIIGGLCYYNMAPFAFFLAFPLMLGIVDIVSAIEAMHD